MNTLKVKIKKLNENAVIPTYPKIEIEELEELSETERGNGGYGSTNIQ